MMNYDVLITPINGHFQATVIGLPNVTVKAHTRQEVIERAKSAAAEILAVSELVKIEMEVAPPINALAAFGGCGKAMNSSLSLYLLSNSIAKLKIEDWTLV